VSRGFDGLAQVITERSRAGGTGVYYLADAHGERRAGNLARLPEWHGTARRGLFRYQRSEGGATRTAAGLLIDIDGQPRLVVGRDIEDQRTLLYAIYRSVGFGAGLLILIGLGGSLLLSRHILARIEGMSRASAGIMSGNLAGRIPVDGSGDELDRLALQLNEMLRRIELLMVGLREVSDNIAHDLKTPLNRLRNRAEAALSDNRGAEAWRQGLERVIDEADELIKTFNALLLIARLEAGSTMEGFETIDLARLVRDVAELYEPVAEEAGFRLDCVVAGELPVRANRQLLGQALANLIDNALKYAATGNGPRQIAVSVSRSGDAATLVVADRGPGIAPEHRERALKRFVRLEQSRSLPGTGLGLSLVAAVARLHGGSLVLEDNAPGLRVVVHLPLASDPSRVARSEAHTPPAMEAARG
jgi:signal transduction histidine kinase